MWISKQEYEEGGKTCVERKCPWYGIITMLCSVPSSCTLKVTVLSDNIGLHSGAWYIFKSDMKRPMS